jgi:limonene 1,2-monooxygenase
VDRNEWRIVVPVHLAETREQALDEVRRGGGNFQREYAEGTLGAPSPFEGPADEIAEYMADQKLWCIGTPDDLVAMLHRLDERSGGFGGLLVQTIDWAGREAMLRSYELIARYVMPQFQGSLVSLVDSQADSARLIPVIRDMQDQAIARARRDYEERGERAPAGSQN